MTKREELNAQDLYKRAMRVRLTRAGLVKIMRENEAREREKNEQGGTAEEGALPEDA